MNKKLNSLSKKSHIVPYRYKVNKKLSGKIMAEADLEFTTNFEILSLEIPYNSMDTDKLH